MTHSRASTIAATVLFVFFIGLPMWLDYTYNTLNPCAIWLFCGLFFDVNRLP